MVHPGTSGGRWGGCGGWRLGAARVLAYHRSVSSCPAGVGDGSTPLWVRAEHVGIDMTGNREKDRGQRGEQNGQKKGKRNNGSRRAKAKKRANRERWAT